MGYSTEAFGPAAAILLCLASGIAGAGIAGAGVAAAAENEEEARKFAITEATIEGGRLTVRGTTRKARQRVRLENRFDTRSDGEGAFSFSVLHHPSDCIVVARSGGPARRAVVANCGEQGARGRKGDRGEAGVGAGQWWYQTLSVNADFPAELRDENGGRISARFNGLLYCAPTGTPPGGTDLIAAQFIIQRNSETPPHWHVSRLTPDSASELLPIVFEEDDVLKLKNRSTAGPWTYACRFERLAS